MFITMKKASLVSSVAALALLLSACSTEGGTRLGGVGLADGSTGAGSGDNGSGSGSGGSGTGDGSGTGSGSGSGGTGSGSGDGSGSGGTGTGNGTGSGGTGTGSGGTGTGSGTGSGSTTGTGLLGGVITTAGNAVLAVGDTTGNLSQPINQTIPATTPVTGTITNVLKDTGQTLVDVGGGKKVLVSGLLGAVGDAVSITALNNVVTSPTSGTSLVGLGVGSDTQPVGSLATVGVLNAGKTATATINGVTNTLLKDVTPGAIDNLVKLTVADKTLGSGTGTPLVGAAIASATPATGQLVGLTVLPTTGSGVASVTSNPVSAVVQQVTGAVGGTAGTGLVGVTVGNTTIGSTNPAVGANVLSTNPVTGSVVTATVPATITAVGGTLTAVTSPSATTPVGGVIAPVTAVVSPVTGTVSAVVTPVIGTVVGTVTGAAGATATATPNTTGLTGLLGGGKGH